MLFCIFAFVLLSVLLRPLSFLYGIAVRVRNVLYDIGVLPSGYAPVNTLVVGNLVAGGTGKTPMIKFLLTHLQEEQPVVLSRGYGRNTKGLREVKLNGRAEDCGDEPLELKCAFPDVPVFVCEDRMQGLEYIRKEYPGTRWVLLDDGFQHRRLLPDISLLLFDYASLSSSMELLPRGKLREPMQALTRGDVVVVTKSPEVPNKTRTEHTLKNFTGPVYFTGIEYDEKLPHAGKNNQLLQANALKDFEVYCITGIAKPEPLYDWLQNKCRVLHPLRFGDHHFFSEKELQEFLRLHKENSNRHVFVCTEKDLVKLKPFINTHEDFPLYVVKTGIQFIPQNDTFALLAFIRNYVRADQRNR